MLQIIKAVLKDEKDTTNVSLLFANQTEEDILLRSELEWLDKQNKNFSLWYTVDHSTEGQCLHGALVISSSSSSSFPHRLALQHWVCEWGDDS